MSPVGCLAFFLWVFKANPFWPCWIALGIIIIHIMTLETKNQQNQALKPTVNLSQYVRDGKMYGPLNSPPMHGWTRERYIHTLPLIYFQKLFQFLPQHNSKSPKKGPKGDLKYDIKFRLCTVSNFPPILIHLVKNYCSVGGKTWTRLK